jgi:CubicO group peptidase (beta-lactamase class C family)
MRLVASGQVELEAPVRRYVPELRLAEERAAAEVTVLNLLNHTAGLDWGFTSDTGEGDDALADYVAKLADLDLIARPGTRAFYSQAGYNLAGRIVEKVTGLTYERAVASLVFKPLGLTHSLVTTPKPPAPAPAMPRAAPGSRSLSATTTCPWANTTSAWTR